MTTPSDDDCAPAARGFLLDCFAGRRLGREVVFGVGRLDSGETFGLVDDAPPALLYVDARDGDKARALARRLGATVRETPLTTMAGLPLLAAEPSPSGALRGLETALRSAGVRVHGSSGLDAAFRYLRERGLRGAISMTGPSRPSETLGRVFERPRVEPASFEPGLSVLAIDLETDESFERLTAASLVGWRTDGRGPETEEVHVVGALPGNAPPHVVGHASETALLSAVLARLRALDPDVLTGWNVIDFDLPLLVRRLRAAGLEPRLGRTREQDAVHQEGRSWGRSRMIVRGRQVLDALHLVRVMPRRFEDLRLESVARALLGRGKTLVAEEWEDQTRLLFDTHRNDPVRFSEYCLEDSRLVRDILRQEKLLDLTVSRSLLVGLPLDRVWGSVASFEFLYGSELHRRGHISPGFDDGTAAEDQEAAAGGLVMEPKAGLHENILVFDFKSLYPSIMRTFNIDPLAHRCADDEHASRASGTSAGPPITAPNGARFARERGILPEILDRFFEFRARAKREGDDVGAFVYKILMNSFYGVLGASSCRFASNALAGAITSFGHLLLRWTRGHFERQGFDVLYGDTDSLFVDVHAPRGTPAGHLLEQGERLCREANEALEVFVRETYGVDSRLELEFEKCYRRFLLPRARGGEGSRAKNYAGLLCENGGDSSVSSSAPSAGRGDIEIIGMEAVRSDWTRAARALQRELLAMLFHDAPPESLEAHVADLIAEVRGGKRDAELVYRKNIRRPLDSYASAPPHVRAARLLPKAVRVVRYQMTVAGPQPLGHVNAPLDYEHYVEKQILPIAESLAEFGNFRVPGGSKAGGGGSGPRQPTLFEMDE